jgi:hypothetical protein
VHVLGYCAEYKTQRKYNSLAFLLALQPIGNAIALREAPRWPNGAQINNTTCTNQR